MEKEEIDELLRPLSTEESLHGLAEALGILDELKAAPMHVVSPAYVDITEIRKKVPEIQKFYKAQQAIKELDKEAQLYHEALNIACKLIAEAEKMIGECYSDHPVFNDYMKKARVTNTIQKGQI